MWRRQGLRPLLILKMKSQKKESKKDASEDYKEMLQRMQAEFENYKKRADKEAADIRKYANAELVKAFLPILDSFEMAFKNTKDKDKFVKGIEMLYAQLYSILEDQGLRPIDCAGRQCDPYYHEVLLQEASDKDGMVLEELQKGYMLNDVVLRHSKVKVGRKHESGEDKND